MQRQMVVKRRYWVSIPKLTAFVLAGLVCGGAVLFSDDSTTEGPSADKLREKFPYESLAARLEGLKRWSGHGCSRSKPKLSAQAEARLREIEQHAAGHGNIRSKSLAMLHGAEVEKFIRREGFGYSRIAIEPSPDFLDYPDQGPLAFAGRPGYSAGEPDSRAVTLPLTGSGMETEGAWFPSIEILSDFNRRDQMSFAGPWSFGYVQDRSHVSGFRAHAFDNLPDLAHPENRQIKEGGETHPERWRIGRLELVSLMKYDEPAVYVSEHLPRMKELQQAGTRPLNEFEVKGLEALRNGDEVIHDAGTNEIHLFGALRAATKCLECHSGQRGDLLGAFSYRLFRDPPVKVSNRPAG